MPSKMKPATGWQRPLASPIKLRDGDVIETLADAAAIMVERFGTASQADLAENRSAADAGVSKHSNQDYGKTSRFATDRSVYL